MMSEMQDDGSGFWSVFLNCVKQETTIVIKAFMYPTFHLIKHIASTRKTNNKQTNMEL